MSEKSITQIVELLRKASEAYYNTSKPILTDNEYDLLREELEEREPNHPFLDEIGAKPSDKTVKLPYPMASLTKIKPNTQQVSHFASKFKQGQWLLSDKLDGISALWCKHRLYLRGDGLNGVDISPLIQHIQGLAASKELVVRGELLITKKDTPTGTIGRSWVNGQLHQKIPQINELKKIRFVAYEIVHPSGYTPNEQMMLLQKSGFEIPWIELVSTISDSVLEQKFTSRRVASIYDTDGIVVATEIKSEPITNFTTVKNPSSKMAFKMLLNEQCANSVVEEVEWNPSAQGYLIPRIRIQPVTVGSARIEFVTGNNARFILSNGIGPGAKVLIRRSGDVIPAIHRIIYPSPTNDLLPVGIEWKWDGDADTASHIVVKNMSNNEVLKSRLLHFAKTFEIPGFGPGVADKLFKANIQSVETLLKANVKTLCDAIGKTNGVKLESAIQDKMKTASEMDWMIASSCLPRGIGKSKLEILFQAENNPTLWTTNLPASLTGWSKDSLQEFLATLPTYKQWRLQNTPSIPYPILPRPVSPPNSTHTLTGTFCFSGFRSKELEKFAAEKGLKMVDSVTSSLTYLIVPDEEQDSESTKVKKAKSYKLKILTKSAFLRDVLGRNI
jgi:DNA ligase (NAD+)